MHFYSAQSAPNTNVRVESLKSIILCGVSCVELFNKERDELSPTKPYIKPIGVFCMTKEIACQK